MKIPPEVIRLYDRYTHGELDRRSFLDRLTALATELNRLGGEVIEHPESLEIHPRPLHGGAWEAYADHRMATSGALAGVAVSGVTVDDIGTTAKTLPEFPELWRAMFARDATATHWESLPL